MTFGYFLTLSVLMLTILQGCFSRATVLSPFFIDSQMGAYVKEMKFPDSFSKDLTSGLTNKILFRFELIDGSHEHLQNVAEVSIKYNLWNENFKIIMVTGNTETSQRTLQTLDEVLSLLSSLRIQNLWSAGQLPKSESFSLKVDVLLNPVEKEQMDKIREWVTKNSLSTPTDVAGVAASRGVSSSRSNELFNRIFTQYSKGTNYASIWRDSKTAGPFSLKELNHEKK